LERRNSFRAVLDVSLLGNFLLVPESMMVNENLEELETTS
jgi:hypothetical protein